MKKHYEEESGDVYGYSMRKRGKQGNMERGELLNLALT